MSSRNGIEAAPRSGRRLFFALCPGQALRVELRDLRRVVLPENRGRPVVEDNLHITLVFLGRVDEDGQGCVERMARDVRCEPFRLVLDSIGYWARPRILWVGASQPPAQLLELVAGLRDGSEKCGFTVDHRPYQAHVTLARKIRKSPGYHEMEPLVWDVHRYSLMESVASPEGVSYHELASWPCRRQGRG